MKRNRKLRLPRLSRRGKILRNLTAALLAALILWGILDYPLPAGLAYRRLEREHFLEPAEIRVVCDNGHGRMTFAEGDGRLYWGITYGGESGSFMAMEWDGSPLLLCNSWMIHKKKGITAAALGVPEEAVSARLELTLTIDRGIKVPESLYYFEPDPTIPETWSEHYTAEARGRDGVFQFQIPRKYPTVTAAANEKQEKAWNNSACEYWAVVYGMGADGMAGYHYDMRVEFYNQSGDVVLVLGQSDETGLAADFWD